MSSTAVKVPYLLVSPSMVITVGLVSTGKEVVGAPGWAGTAEPALRRAGAAVCNVIGAGCRPGRERDAGERVAGVRW
jgi:hypothetical protein